MKLIFTLLIILIFPLALFAQSLKSSILVSTNFSYRKDKTSLSTSSTIDVIKTINLQPKIGYFIFNRICIGIYLPYSREVRSYNSGMQTLRDKNFGIGPFAKYYQPLYKEKLYMVINTGYSWSTSKDQVLIYSYPADPSIYEIKNKVNSYTLGIGLSYFLEENVSIEFMTDYVEEITDESGPSPYVYKDYYILTLGLQIYLRKK